MVTSLKTPSRIASSAVAATLLALTSIGVAYAHPHVWIHQRSDLVFDASGKVTGINVEWQFDEYYSITAIEGLDTNKNGTYEPGELAPLAKENIESLKEYRYFTQAKANDKPIEYNDVTEFGSFVKGDHLTLYFSIPFKKPVEPKAEKISYSMYDPSFYIAIEFAAKDAINMTGTVPKGCTVEIADSEADAADTENPESFYEKFAESQDIGGLYAQNINLNCLRKTAAK